MPRDEDGNPQLLTGTGPYGDELTVWDVLGARCLYFGIGSAPGSAGFNSDGMRVGLPLARRLRNVLTERLDRAPRKPRPTCGCGVRRLFGGLVKTVEVVFHHDRLLLTSDGNAALDWHQVQEIRNALTIWLDDPHAKRLQR